MSKSKKLQGPLEETHLCAYNEGTHLCAYNEGTLCCLQRPLVFALKCQNVGEFLPSEELPVLNSFCCPLLQWSWHSKDGSLNLSVYRSDSKGIELVL